MLLIDLFRKLEHLQWGRYLNILGYDIFRDTYNTSVQDGIIPPYQVVSYWRCETGLTIKNVYCRIGRSSTLHLLMMNFHYNDEKTLIFNSTKVLFCTPGNGLAVRNISSLKLFYNFLNCYPVKFSYIYCKIVQQELPPTLISFIR